MAKSSTLHNSFMLVLSGRLVFKPLMMKILKDVELLGCFFTEGRQRSLIPSERFIYTWTLVKRLLLVFS